MFTEVLKDFFVTPFVRGAHYFVAFFLALTFTLVLTPLVRRLTKVLGMMDMPDARRVHKTPIPRGGGLAVILAFHATVLCFLWTADAAQGALEATYWPFLWASLALGVVGFIDDLKGMRALYKLIAQIGVATFLYFSGFVFKVPFLCPGCLSGILPGLEYLLTLLWIVGAINAFNLIDGLDGLATGLAAIACVGMAGALFFSNHMINILPYCVLLGCCLGFLRYNFNPASIFLGDTGSMFLGLALAVLPLQNQMRGEAIVTIIVPLLAMGVPIVDTTLAILRRFLRAHVRKYYPDAGSAGAGVMEADKEHLHHRILVHAQGAQRKAVYTIYVMSICLVCLALSLILMRRAQTAIFLLAFLAAAIVVIRHMVRVELWDASRLLAGRHLRVSPRRISMPFYVLCDVAILTFSFILMCTLLRLNLPRTSMLLILPLYVAPSFIAIAMTQAYRRIWLRAVVRDHLLLAVAVCIGGVVTFGLRMFLGVNNGGEVVPVVLFTLMACPCIIFVRLSRIILVDLGTLIERVRLQDSSTAERILIYGGGLQFRSFLRNMQKSFSLNTAWIVGVIDDDPNLRGTIVYGHEVLGTRRDLEQAITLKKPTKIICTVGLPHGERRKLIKIADQHDLPVFDFRMDYELAPEERGDV